MKTRVSLKYFVSYCRLMAYDSSFSILDWSFLKWSLWVLTLLHILNFLLLNIYSDFLSSLNVYNIPKGSLFDINRVLSSAEPFFLSISSSAAEGTAVYISLKAVYYGTSWAIFKPKLKNIPKKGSYISGNGTFLLQKKLIKLVFKLQAIKNLIKLP